MCVGAGCAGTADVHLGRCSGKVSIEGVEGLRELDEALSSHLLRQEECKGHGLTVGRGGKDTNEDLCISSEKDMNCFAR